MAQKRAIIITAVGAGGKTTFLKSRALGYVRSGRKAAVTTTTHIWKPEGTMEGDYLLHAPDGIDYVGTPHEDGKLSSPPDKVWEQILAQYDAVLVEGDGSHCMPVKIPSEKEPVIPPHTDEIAVVMGRQAVGRRLSVVCHRFDERRIEDGIVTDAMLEEIAQEFYIRPLREQYPKADVYYAPSEYRPVGGSLPVTAVLLASGFGRRYGGNKLMEEFDAKPLYRHALEHVIRALGADHVVVVTQYQDIMDEMAAEGITALKNDYAREGISASIRIGTEEAWGRSDREAVIFFAADMPYLPPDEIRSYVQQFLWSGKTYACMESGPDHIMTNPGAFRLSAVKELLSLTGDRGAMRIMKQHPQDIYRYQIGEEAVRDIDVRCAP